MSDGRVVQSPMHAGGNPSVDASLLSARRQAHVAASTVEQSTVAAAAVPVPDDDFVPLIWDGAENSVLFAPRHSDLANVSAAFVADIC